MGNKIDTVIQPEQNIWVHIVLRTIVLILLLVVMGVIAIASYSNLMLLLVDVLLLVIWYIFMIRETIILGKKNADKLKRVNITIMLIVLAPVLLLIVALFSNDFE